MINDKGIYLDQKRESLPINNDSSATFDGINFATAD